MFSFHPEKSPVSFVVGVGAGFTSLELITLSKLDNWRGDRRNSRRNFKINSIKKQILTKKWKYCNLWRHPHPPPHIPRIVTLLCIKSNVKFSFCRISFHSSCFTIVKSLFDNFVYAKCLWMRNEWEFCIKFHRSAAKGPRSYVMSALQSRGRGKWTFGALISRGSPSDKGGGTKICLIHCTFQLVVVHLRKVRWPPAIRFISYHQLDWSVCAVLRSFLLFFHLARKRFRARLSPTSPESSMNARFRSSCFFRVGNSPSIQQKKFSIPSCARSSAEFTSECEVKCLASRMKWFDSKMVKTRCCRKAFGNLSERGVLTRDDRER